MGNHCIANILYITQFCLETSIHVGYLGLNVLLFDVHALQLAVLAVDCLLSSTIV